MSEEEEEKISNPDEPEQTINLNLNKKEKDYLTAAYENFRERICSKYLICDNIENISLLEEKLGMKYGNTDHLSWEKYMCCAYAGILCVCPYIYYSTRTKFQVKKNSFAFVETDQGDSKKTEIYGPGYHILGRYCRYLDSYNFANIRYPDNWIKSEVEDMQLAVVEQGTLMHFEWSGQVLLLGPGIHLINDPLTFVRTISLDTFYIEIATEKWITIPEGYDGISIRLGEVNVLKGGKQHYLAHVGDKFVKMVPKMLQTDRIATDIPAYVSNSTKKNIRFDMNDPSMFLTTTTAEGSPVILDAMVFWRIMDTKLACKNAMEILVVDERAFNSGESLGDYYIRNASKNINLLKQNVLRIVKTHVTNLIGRCSITGNEDTLDSKKLDDDTIRTNTDPRKPQKKEQKKVHSFDLLTVMQRAQTQLVNLCNSDLEKIGCKVDSICVYAVLPTRQIQEELNRQIRARVEFNTSVIQAKSNSKTTDIKTKMQNDKKLKDAEAASREDNLLAEAEALETKLMAEGNAQAIEEIAKARKMEGEKFKEIPIAAELARIRVAGEMGEGLLNGKDNTFIFGNHPGGAVLQFVKSFLEV